MSNKKVSAKNVMLAEKWSESIDPKGYWMSEKLDGVRAFWTGSDFYSRQGNLFHAPEFFKEALPDIALDGELWCGRGLFQRCVSIVKKKNDKVIEEDWKFVNFVIFDAPEAKGTFEERYKYLQKKISSIKEDHYAIVVGQELCNSKDHLNENMKKVLEKGGEGVMLRKPKSEYVCGRSTTLLKVKTFHDEEAKVLGSQKGSGRCSGMMGHIECILPNGIEFDIGTGFNDSQRKKPPKKGSVITFKYQELSNSGKPRFPVFLRERKDITWDDVLENAKTKIPFSQVQKPVRVLKKQHTILFTVAPSRDQETGKKQITSDDEDSTEEEAKKKGVVRMGSNSGNPSSTLKKATTCPYGALCYRASQQHLSKYKHDDNHLKKVADKKKSSKKTKLIPCRFGATCYRKSDTHLAKYSHDPNNANGDDDNDNNIIDSSELTEDEKDSSINNNNNNNNNIISINNNNNNNNNNSNVKGNVGKFIVRNDDDDVDDNPTQPLSDSPLLKKKDSKSKQVKIEVKKDVIATKKKKEEKEDITKKKKKVKSGLESDEDLLDSEDKTPIIIKKKPSIQRTPTQDKDDMSTQEMTPTEKPSHKRSHHDLLSIGDHPHPHPSPSSSSSSKKSDQHLSEILTLINNQNKIIENLQTRISQLEILVIPNNNKKTSSQKKRKIDKN